MAANLKSKIAEVLNRFPEVTWDRWAGVVDDRSIVYGWIDRDDGRFDFLVINFDEGEPWMFVTSAAKYSESISERMGFGSASDGHRDCMRVEDHFPGVKAGKIAGGPPALL